MMSNWKEKYRQFREWQERPYEVQPMSQEEHDCATCSTHYTGNYCPRCGQSASIGRYSFKNAILLFLNVWGLGNRGMFRTLRDLIFRPGFMIRDYLSGMQMAYFPPFKMLFLLTALSVIVAHGVNLRGRTVDDQRQDAIDIVAQSGDGSGIEMPVLDMINRTVDLQERFPNLLSLTTVFFLTVFYYLFFRKSKNIPDLRFSEFLIAMVYTANMLTIYEVLLAFIGVNSTYSTLASVLTVIPLKQLSGFSWIRTILSMVAAIVILYIIAVFLGIVIYIALLLAGVIPPPVLPE